MMSYMCDEPDFAEKEIPTKKICVSFLKSPENELHANRFSLIQVDNVM